MKLKLGLLHRLFIAMAVGVAIGFTPVRYAIMIALYMALDGMGTACNLTGDGAIALIVDRLKGNEKSAKCASCPTQMR